MAIRSLLKCALGPQVAMFLPVVIGGCSAEASLATPNETEPAPNVGEATLNDVAASQVLGDIELFGVRPSAYLMASQQDDALQEAGFHLDARLWVSSSLATSTYADDSGLRVGVLLGRVEGQLPNDWKLALEFQHRPQEEDAAAFATRVLPNVDSHVLQAERLGFAPAMVVFDATSLESVKTSELQTVGAIEKCSGFIGSYNSWAGGCYGWYGVKSPSTLLEKWDEREYTNVRPAHVGDQINGAWGLACVDKGTATYTASFSNPRWGAAPTSTTLTLPVNGGYATATQLFGEDRQEWYCGTNFLGICDERFRIRFNHYTVSLRAIPGSNSEMIFGGTFTRKADEYWGDYSCADTAQCPSKRYPSEGVCPFGN